METAISVKGLTKSFKKNKVLQGVDLTVKRGSIFALLGSNGAGKTTTINILTTLIKDDGGMAKVSGFDVAKQPAKVRQAISLTGQFAAVDNRLTARENLALIADLRHIKNAAQTTTVLLKKFDLSKAADRPVQTFSGGMRRRLDIAMSLIGNPSIIFLDEPTTGLDPEARNDMWQTIKTLSKTGTTIFLTTQYLEEADQLADTIAVLHEGKIAANGTASELKKRVPGGHISFTFADRAQRDKAEALLTKDYQTMNAGDMGLTITTDGGTAQVAQLFGRLHDARLEPTEFSQKTPTLDDVFFSLIGAKKEEQ